MSRELLKEAAQALETVQHYFPAQDEADKGLAVADVDACQRLMTKIEAYLAEPEPDAMEIVEKLRLGGYALNANDPDDRGPNGDDYHFTFSKAEAAALIEDYGRRVPRVMLEEIFDNGYQAGELMGDYEDVTSETKNFEAIADKYGVKLEPPVGKEGEE